MSIDWLIFITKEKMRKTDAEKAVCTGDIKRLGPLQWILDELPALISKDTMLSRSLSNLFLPTDWQEKI